MGDQQYLKTIAALTEGPQRELGLSFIMDLLERGEMITAEHIETFLKDLGLPRMRRSSIEKEMRAAGASSEGITKLAQFSEFVKNQLVEYDPEVIVESFMAFDEQDIGYIPIDLIR